MPAATPSRFDQAQAFLERGEFARARQGFMRLLQAHPAEPAVLLGLGRACSRLNERDAALFYARRLAQLRRPEHGVIQGAAHLLMECAAGDEAVAELRRGLSLFPDDRVFLEMTATVHYYTNQSAAGIALCEDAVRRGVASTSLRMALGGMYRQVGRVREANDAFLAQARANPADADAWLQLAISVHYDGRFSPQEALDAQKNYAMARMRAAPQVAFKNPPTDDPERPLRLGFVSPDFRGHSCAFFLEPLLERLAAMGVDFECFSTTPNEDEVTQRFRAIAPAFHVVWQLPVPQVATEVRKRRIDVAFDLAGLTVGSGLSAFLHRPAPLQINYLGYPSSTGVPTMDWRFVDSHTDPPGAEALSTERLARLDPCFLCYRPRAPEAAPKEPSSATPDDAVTFASFNILTKVDDGVIDAWSRVLRALPRAKLLLKGAMLREADVRERVLRQFAARDVPAQRLELIAWLDDAREHLALYRRVDIALDPFPYNGTTTTCEALMMGVPVIALAGDRHCARVGVTLLSALGRADLLAPDVDQYVELACALARDPARRKDLHATLPRAFAASPLRDEEGFARRFMAAVRHAWRVRCGVPGPGA